VVIVNFFFSIFVSFLDSSHFDRLLDLCEKWKLSSFKEHIEDYFFHHHHNGLINFNGKLTLEALTILKLADKHKLVKYCDAFLRNTQKIPYCQNNERNFRACFKSSSPKLRYEVLKKIVLYNCDGNTKLIEIIVIFNFLDLILYDNRVHDLSIRNPYQGDDELKRPTAIDLTNDIGDENNVIVKVEGHEIHINSITLTENSRVFHTMLNSTFREGQERIVELPGKKIDDVLEFFSYLSKPRVMNGSNLFK